MFNSLHYFSEVTKNLINAPGSNLLYIWLFMNETVGRKITLEGGVNRVIGKLKIFQNRQQYCFKE